MTIKIILAVLAVIGWTFYFIQRHHAKKTQAGLREAIAIAKESNDAHKKTLSTWKKREWLWAALCIAYFIWGFVFGRRRSE